MKYYTFNITKLLKHPSLLFNQFFCGELKYKIETWFNPPWFNPRQKWLTRTIPNTWCDKTTLIPQLLFECLVHYVEEEKGLQDQLDWTSDLKEGHLTQDYLDTIKKRDKTLRNAYNYIKFERPELQLQHENSYPEIKTPCKEMFAVTEDGHSTLRSCEDLYDMPYKQAYAENHRLEKLIEKKDMMTMNVIVKYYQYLWT